MHVHVSVQYKVCTPVSAHIQLIIACKLHLNIPGLGE